MKIHLSIGCLMIILAIACLFSGIPWNAPGPVVFGAFELSYVAFLPKIAIRNQFKSHKHMSEEGVYQFDESHFSIDRPLATGIDAVVRRSQRCRIYRFVRHFHDEGLLQRSSQTIPGHRRDQIIARHFSESATRKSEADDVNPLT